MTAAGSAVVVPESPAPAMSTEAPAIGERGAFPTPVIRVGIACATVPPCPALGGKAALPAIAAAAPASFAVFPAAAALGCAGGCAGGIAGGGLGSGRGASPIALACSARCAEAGRIRLARCNNPCPAGDGPSTLTGCKVACELAVLFALIAVCVIRTAPIGLSPDFLLPGRAASFPRARSSAALPVSSRSRFGTPIASV